MSITTALLDALLSSGASRQQAEIVLNSMSLVDRIQGLMNVLHSPALADGPMLMAFVLLRRNVASLGEESLRNPSVNGVDLLKSLVEPLLQLFQSLSSACQRQVGFVLTEVCCSLSLLSANDSQAALHSILNAIAPMVRNGSAIALRVLANLVDRVSSSLFCQSIASEQLSTLLQEALNKCSQPNQVAALMEAVVYVAIATEVKGDATPVGLRVPSSPLTNLTVDPNSPAARLGTSILLPLLRKMTSLNFDSALQASFQHLEYAADNAPSLLAGNVQVLQVLVQFALELTDEEATCMALQVVASVCGVAFVERSILPTRSQLSNVILNQVLRKCAELCISGVDDEMYEWASEPATIMEDVPTWEGDDIALFAGSLLESFLHALGGTRALPVVLPMVETLLASNTEWKYQRAAMSILEQCLYAAPVTFSQHVPVAVEAALHLATNTNLRVQFQAIVLLGALCEKSNVDIRSTYGAHILQVLGEAVQNRCTKISAVACLTLVSYCRGDNNINEKERSSFVAPSLKNLLMALVAGPLSWEVSSETVAVKIRAIGAVACLAQVCGDAFCPFYGDVMPGLLGCVQLPSPSYEMSRLRGSAVEAATIVGQAVSESNRDLYVGDAETIMKIALPILQTDDSLSATSIPIDELLAACARVASVMGEEYAPFVGVVLPHLLSRVVAPPDVQFSEGDEAGFEATKRGDTEMNDEEGTESMTFNLPGKGLTKVTLNTTKIMEKSQAARAIYEHAAALGSAFGPYAERTITSLIQSVNFKYSPEVRSTVAQAISAVFESACLYGESVGMNVPQIYLPLLADSISKQIVVEDPSDAECFFALADSLSDVFYFAYRTLDVPNSSRSILGSFTETQATVIVQRAMKAMLSCLRRRARLLRAQEGASGEDEEEEYDQALQGEQQILTPLVDVSGYVIKFFRDASLPIFESEVAPILGPYLKAGGTADNRARWAAVCLFDDCIEHCGSAAASKFAPYLLEGALLGINDTTNGQDITLKQVSLYGVAQIARYAPGASVIPQAERLVNMLVNISNVPKDEADNAAIVENGVSALASLTLIGSAPLGKSMDPARKNTITSIFLDQLPLREDESEAKFCHSGLCDLVQNGQVLVTTETERLLRIIGEVFSHVADGEDIASPETQSRLAEILVKIQNEVPPDRIQDAFGSLAEDVQCSINAVMDEHRLHSSGANRISP